MCPMEGVILEAWRREIGNGEAELFIKIRERLTRRLREWEPVQPRRRTIAYNRGIPAGVFHPFSCPSTIDFCR